MSLTEPSVVDTELESVVALRNKLTGLSRRRVICHCCRFERRSGAPVTKMIRTLDSGAEEELGRWDFQLDPPNDGVIMRRSAAKQKLASITFTTADTNTELRDKIIDALEDIRLAGGVVASDADIQALKDAVDSELA